MNSEKSGNCFLVVTLSKCQYYLSGESQYCLAVTLKLEIASIVWYKHWKSQCCLAVTLSMCQFLSLDMNSEKISVFFLAVTLWKCQCRLIWTLSRQYCLTVSLWKCQYCLIWTLKKCQYCLAVCESVSIVDFKCWLVFCWYFLLAIYILK